MSDLNRAVLVLVTPAEHRLLPVADIRFRESRLVTGCLQQFFSNFCVRKSVQVCEIHQPCCPAYLLYQRYLELTRAHITKHFGMFKTANYGTVGYTFEPCRVHASR